VTRLNWRPLSGLVHPYREQAVAEIEAALPELARGRQGVPVRIKYTLHGYQAQIGVLRPDCSGMAMPKEVSE
jgi:hypothetical protein